MEPYSESMAVQTKANSDLVAIRTMRYICTAKCPEMDRNGLGHCVEHQDEYCHAYFAEYGCCPVGNIPIWIPYDRGDENHMRNEEDMDAFEQVMFVVQEGR